MIKLKLYILKSIKKKPMKKIKFINLSNNFF